MSTELGVNQTAPVDSLRVTGLVPQRTRDEDAEREREREKRGVSGAAREFIHPTIPFGAVSAWGMEQQRFNCSTSFILRDGM